MKVCGDVTTLKVADDVTTLKVCDVVTALKVADDVRTLKVSSDVVTTLKVGNGRVMETGHPSTRAVNLGRQLG